MKFNIYLFSNNKIIKVRNGPNDLANTLKVCEKYTTHRSKDKNTRSSDEIIRIHGTMNKW